MSWLVSVVVPSPDIDLVSSLLWDLGTTGVAETPTEPAPATLLIAGFEERDGAESALGELTDLGLIASVEPYVADWASRRSVSVRRPGLAFTIEVGEAFGHGDHPTTVLCLDLLRKVLVGSSASRSSVLDVGTGTGILAIAAAHLGARPVVAVENDPAAKEVATRNIAANGADVALCCRLEQALPGPGQQPYDLLVANLLLSDLRPLAPAFALAARQLVLGGFLIEQEAEVLGLFPEWTPTRRVESGGWVSLMLDRSTPGVI